MPLNVLRLYSDISTIYDFFQGTAELILEINGDFDSGNHSKIEGGVGVAKNDECNSRGLGPPNRSPKREIAYKPKLVDLPQI